MAVSKEKVYQVIRSFWKEGVQPTYSDVRERLGDTGSFTTICKYMREWHAEVMNKTVNQHAGVIENLNDMYGELHSKCGELKIENHKLKSEIRILKDHLNKAGLLESTKSLGF